MVQTFGFAITTVSELSTKPSALHYYYLKQVAKPLRLAKNWGIEFKQTIDCSELRESKLWPEVVLDEKLPEFPVNTNQPRLIVFVDAAYANDII